MFGSNALGILANRSKSGVPSSRRRDRQRLAVENLEPRRVLSIGNLTGQAWLDADGDGIRSVEEPPLAGVSILVTDEANGLWMQDATGPDGRYTIIGEQIPPGTITLAFNLPPGMAFSPTKVGGEADSDVGPDGRIVLTVADSEEVPPIDAGLTTESRLPEVFGIAWEDLDGDGMREAGEPPIEGITLSIRSRDFYGFFADGVSAPDGTYRFANVAPGDYDMDHNSWIIGAAGWSVTTLYRGQDPDLDNDFNAYLGKTSGVRLLPGSDDVRRDIGLYRPVTVTGVVWEDTDRDGVRAATERTVAGIPVRLLDAQGTAVAQTTTGAAGEYSVNDLAPGEYQVEFVFATGITASVPAQGSDPALDSDVDPTTHRTPLAVHPSGATVALDAGMRGVGTTTGISGRVWQDVNGNGLQDAGEPGLAGVPTTLLPTGGGAPLAQNTSGPDGSYVFTDLAPGSYRVAFAPASGVISPFRLANEQRTESDAVRSTGQTLPLVLVAWQELSSVDVGIYDGPLSTNNLDDLRITEISFIGSNGTAPEFLELKNIGEQPLSLTGVRLTRGVAFDFTNSSVKVLFPGEHVVVTGSMQLLANTQPRFHEILVAGVYTGDLNQQERLQLADAAGNAVLDFTYDDAWFTITQDEATIPWTFHLLRDDLPSARFGFRESWRPSSHVYGSPGFPEPAATQTPGTGQPPPTLNPGTVVINEIISRPADGFNDQIELYNTTDEDIDIGGWYLGDTENIRDIDDIARYRIADGTIIPAKSYLVFTREQHFGNINDRGSYDPFGLSSYGEAVNLTGADDSGVLFAYSESFRFNAAHWDTSFGRYITASGDVVYTPLRHATIGAANTLPHVGPIVISELMANPALGEAEFIELHNISDQDIVLGYRSELNVDGAWIEGWQLTDSTSNVTWFPLGAVLPAGGRAVLTGEDAGAFRTRYGVPDEVAIYPLAGRIDAGGESIRLGETRLEMHEEGFLTTRSFDVDIVNFDDVAPWPIISPTGGNSLERIASTAFGNDAAYWAASTVLHGTPGWANSATNPLPADLDGDGRVGVGDAIVLRNQLGSEQFAFYGGDLDGDGVVGRSDLAAFVGSFGTRTASQGGSAPAAIVNRLSARAVDRSHDCEPATAARATASAQVRVRREVRAEMVAASAVDAVLSVESPFESLRTPSQRRLLRAIGR